MNICLVSQALPYLPSRGGFRLYGANLIRCLSKRHRVDLVSLLVDHDREHLDWPRPYCSQVETIDVGHPRLPMRAANFVAGYLSGTALHHRAELAEILSRGIAAARWDVIHFEGDYVASLMAGRLPVPTVLSLHDSWTLRCREMLACAQNWREKLHYSALAAREPRFERQLYPKFDRCIVVADRDLAEVKRVVPGARAELIPYGTDTDYFHPVHLEKQPSSLVFHGHLGYPPNVEAVTEFARVIFPLVRREAREATFHIVGADPAPQVRALATLDGVRLSENLPDIRPSVCGSSIYVCAIRHGTGLKSKVLEAMAMRMPIVAYHPGSTVGIACVHDKHLMAAETPESFARYVLLLLRHPERAERLARAARQLTEEQYSWESRAIAYEDLYRQLQTERRRAA
ncbi:MAG TPA: glycosyltransferase family 4 protein [Candidatus Dormibacteraeota bacterium]|nr:glycosyltransferase family 4 protein [Candidatus Dormibacteraeota bacterium]